MARYIDADKAEEKFKEIYCDNCDSRNGVKCRACGFRDGADVFSDAPTEDVQPVVHAKWIDRKDCHSCSNCGAVLEEDYKWHYHVYCYHCGAIMVKV